MRTYKGEEEVRVRANVSKIVSREFLLLGPAKNPLEDRVRFQLAR